MQPHPDSLKALSRMLDYWSGRQISEATTRAYVEVITGTDLRLPVCVSDVQEAVKRICNGDVPRKSHEFLPEPGFLAAVIRECRNERLTEDARNKPRLAPPAPREKTPGEIQAVKQIIRNWRQGWQDNQAKPENQIVDLSHFPDRPDLEVLLAQVPDRKQAKVSV